MREIKLRKNEMKLRKNEITSPNYFSFPPEQSNSSSVGTKKFQEGNPFWNSYVSEIECDMMPRRRGLEHCVLVVVERLGDVEREVLQFVDLTDGREGDGGDELCVAILLVVEH